MGEALITELRRMADERSTGTLTVGDGVLHFADGRITGAGCPRTPGLEQLVVTTGLATADDWQRAQAGDPGPILRRPRLQMLAMLAVFDAAYFLLAEPGTPEFRPAPAQWLAAVCRIPLEVLVHECDRRHAAEPGSWPLELVDRAPVVPARRTRRKRVPLTGGEAEILAAADARRSIAGIAGDLGRTSYGCLVAVRRLTRVGLLEAPSAARPPAVPAAPAPAPAALAPLPRRRRITVVPPEAPPRAPGPRHAAAADPPENAAGQHDSAPSGAGPRHAVPAEPGETSAPRATVAPAEAAAVPEIWKPVDRELLVRLRTALEEFV
ncbi:hypothetical protein [Nocardia sp. BMG111209]|uniref:hypothetical protein n=1 Tax=Nocardia sp. BMG111209 TaxID=1160137 RepID=UPI0003681AF9|nr:hypothetical protein [Nocardia sp. BMG111209]